MLYIKIFGVLKKTCIFVCMIIDKHIDKNNWDEIKDILPQITVIKSLNLSYMGLTEFPEMSHITIIYSFDCSHNQITSFTDCPIVNGDFYCQNNKLSSFKDCPKIGGDFWCFHNPITSFKDFPEIEGYLHSNFYVFDKVHVYSKEKKISLLEAQVELYNPKDKEILEHIDKFPDLVAYHRMRELNKLLCA